MSFLLEQLCQEIDEQPQLIPDETERFLIVCVPLYVSAMAHRQPVPQLRFPELYYLYCVHCM
ncbi:Uncharacterised protein [Mycobacteroides abscessus subsp. abscessus]|nr:Uncharacterised protein [Mycobacteroides abscessus subsp. abscessus]